VQEREAVDVVAGALAVAVAAVWAVVGPAATGVRAGLSRAGLGYRELRAGLVGGTFSAALACQFIPDR